MSNNDLFGIFAGVGMVLVIIAGKLAWRWLRTHRWRTVDGIVEAASWRIKGVGEDSEVYELLVTYSYTVDGVRYASSRVALGGRTFGAQRKVEQAVAHYPPRTRVTVYYSPRQAGESVLERTRPGWWTVALAIAGVAIFVLGGILFPADR